MRYSHFPVALPGRAPRWAPWAVLGLWVLAALTRPGEIDGARPRTTGVTAQLVALTGNEDLPRHLNLGLGVAAVIGTCAVGVKMLVPPLDPGPAADLDDDDGGPTLPA